jgi:hypothetical protein
MLFYVNGGRGNCEKLLKIYLRKDEAVKKKTEKKWGRGIAEQKMLSIFAAALNAMGRKVL